MIFPCESVLVNLDSGGEKNMGHKSKHITEAFWVRPQEPRWGLFNSTVLTLGVRTKGSTMDNWVPSPANTGVTLGPRLFVPERVGEDLLYWGRGQ